MKTYSCSSILVTTLFALAITAPGFSQEQRQTAGGEPGHAVAAKKHHHYKLIVLGTLGGPQSYGDPGHNAANINNQGIALGVADTAAPDPFYPNFNPVFSSLIGQYPLVYHVFTTRGGALVDLGGLPGGGNSNASFITENGLVSGQALNGSIDPITGWPAENAVIWKDDHIINLGSLGGYESQAGRVNSRGQVTGFATNGIPDPFSIFYALFGGFTNGTQTRAFLWDEKRGMQDIGTLGGPDAVAPFINERGQIAGFSYTNSTPSATTGVPTQDPFLWEKGTMIDLGTLGGTSGGAGGLNNRGQVVGQSNLAGDVTAHAFLWEKGRLMDLGTLGGSFSGANTIHDNGEIIGGSTTQDDLAFHAFIWKRGVMTDLGTVGTGGCSNAFGINSVGQVVGQSFDCSNTLLAQRAFLWEKSEIIDLNVFVPPTVDITLYDTEQINERGEIFGIGTLANGELRAFLLIPCDETHPNIEGCDYGPMEVSTVAAGHTAPQKQLTPKEISRIHALLMNRHRGFMPGTTE
jgi:probable HAF family extracellular repeat protein